MMIDRRMNGTDRVEGGKKCEMPKNVFHVRIYDGDGCFARNNGGA